MLEWLRLIFFTLFLAAGLLCEGLAILGVNRLKYAMNRLHPATIGDTLGVMFIVLASVVYDGFTMISLKLIFVVAFMWMTCPLSGHLMSLLIYRTDRELTEEARIWKG